MSCWPEEETTQLMVDDEYPASEAEADSDLASSTRKVGYHVKYT